LEPEEEFGPQGFTTRDLFELHLADSIKFLPYVGPMGLSRKLRDTLMAQSAATAQLTMLLYIMGKADGE
jgi:hypothetical protein